MMRNRICRWLGICPRCLGFKNVARLRHLSVPRLLLDRVRYRSSLVPCISCRSTGKALSSSSGTSSPG